MIELKSTQANITLKSPTVVSGSVDLSNYYTKAETEALIPDVSGFITGSEADTKISTAVSLAEERVDFKLGSYALKTEIPDVSGFITEIPGEYVTETELNAKGYLTEHQSLSNYYTKGQVDAAIDAIPAPDLTDYAKKTDIPSLDGYAKTTDIPDVSGFQTEAQVNTLINNALGVIENGTY